MKLVTVLKILVEAFPYEAMGPDFKGNHCVMLDPDNDNAVLLGIWCHGSCWPISVTLDEFEKDEAGLRVLVQDIKAAIDLAAEFKIK